MKYREFIEDLQEEIEDWFVPIKAFENDLKFLGWRVRNLKFLYAYDDSFEELNVICTNPNFYSDGEIIADSRQSLIQASGNIKFNYKNKIYENFVELFREFGSEVVNDFSNIQWLEVMDWIIVSKKENYLLGQYDNWDNIPKRKEVER
jgi:hypothetical protein